MCPLSPYWTSGGHICLESRLDVMAGQMWPRIQALIISTRNKGFRKVKRLAHLQVRGAYCLNDTGHACLGMILDVCLGPEGLTQHLAVGTQRSLRRVAQLQAVLGHAVQPLLLLLGLATDPEPFPSDPRSSLGPVRGTVAQGSC